MPDADTRSGRPAEDPDPLPPLEELFSDLQSDDYIERLEELAESLLREVTAEVEANPHRSNEQVSLESCSRCNNTITLAIILFSFVCGSISGRSVSILNLQRNIVFSFFKSVYANKFEIL